VDLLNKSSTSSQICHLMMTATHTHTNTTLASIQKAPSYSHYFQVQLARNVKCAHKHDRKTTQTSDDNSDPSQIQHWLLVLKIFQVTDQTNILDWQPKSI